MDHWRSHPLLVELVCDHPVCALKLAEGPPGKLTETLKPTENPMDGAWFKPTLGWARTDLNRRPTGYEPVALSRTKLRAHAR